MVAEAELRFDDALSQAAVVAAEMQRRGWLKGGDGPLAPEDWEHVARAVRDEGFAARNPHLSQAAGILNTATQVSMEKFDRSMRDLARRRQLEYEPEAGRRTGADRVRRRSVPRPRPAAAQTGSRPCCASPRERTGTEPSQNCASTAHCWQESPGWRKSIAC